MKKYVFPAIRKSVILLTGIPVIILGIILIPLPGPGLLVILAGFLILALEFEWAARHRDRLHGHIKKTVEKARQRTSKSNQSDKTTDK